MMPWSGVNTLKRTSSTEQIVERTPTYELGVVSVQPANAVCVIDCDMEVDGVSWHKFVSSAQVEIAPLDDGGECTRHPMLAVGAEGYPGQVQVWPWHADGSVRSVGGGVRVFRGAHRRDAGERAGAA